jgi:hypothetical protein
MSDDRLDLILARTRQAQMTMLALTITLAALGATLLWGLLP